MARIVGLGLSIKGQAGVSRVETADVGSLRVATGPAVVSFSMPLLMAASFHHLRGKVAWLVRRWQAEVSAMSGLPGTKVASLMNLPPLDEEACWKLVTGVRSEMAN
ncbi:hypothetical protein AX14_008876 [Amanita brunnescens Koide BX004]|nr:hypothetical protein AX14_008876 [Amanita brunnescens Koide BX004]